MFEKTKLYFSDMLNLLFLSGMVGVDRKFYNLLVGYWFGYV